MESFLNSHFQLLSEPTFGRAKKIRVWINGDLAKKCFEITLNPNVLRTWNSVLQYLTHTIYPPFGAVRKLVCLSSKKAVTCFEELESPEKYIALGANSKLIILNHGYNSPSEQELLKPRKTRKKFYSGDMNATNFQFLQETKRRNLTVVYMVVNGQACQSPTKVVLNENDLTHWDVSLKYLSKILDVPDGIQHICTIFGDMVTDPFELQHGFLYVALPFNEKFEKIDYTNTFGRERNKSSYVLKIRKKSQPSRICCPIKSMPPNCFNEKSNKFQKADCIRIKCLKEIGDDRECRALLPEEIPDSCRTVIVEDENDMTKGNNCCLQSKEANLWCRIKKYNPGCCEKANQSGGVRKEKPVIKSVSLKARKKNLNGSEGIAVDTKPETAPESPEKDEEQEKEGEGESTKKSAPDEQNSEDVDENEPPLDPAQGNIQNDENDIDVDGNLSLDSIEDSSADSDQVTTQKNDQIVTYFSRVDNVPTKPLISTTISRSTQTVADFPPHVARTNRSALFEEMRPEKMSPTDEPCRIPPMSDFPEPNRAGNLNSALKNINSTYVKENPVDIGIVDDDGNCWGSDKCVNTEISMMQETNLPFEEYSDYSQFLTSDLGKPIGRKMNKGISAILSEMNVYPDREPKRLPSICIRNRTDINVVGYSKNGKRYRCEDIKNCYGSSSASESPSTPDNENLEKYDNLCCFCREARKADGSISRILRSKHLSRSKKKRPAEERVMLEEPLENIDIDETLDGNNNPEPTKHSDSLTEENLHISEERSKSATSIMEPNVTETSKKSILENSNDEEIIKDNLNTVKIGISGVFWGVPSVNSEKPQQTLQKERNSQQNNAIDQNVDDNVSFSDSEQAQENPPKKRKCHLNNKENMSSTVQNLEKTPDTDSVKIIGERSEQTLTSPRRKSSQRKSAISAVGKVMTTIDQNLENVLLNSEQSQEISPEKIKSHLRKKESACGTAQNVGNVPDIDSVKSLQTLPRRKSSQRNSATIDRNFENNVSGTIQNVDNNIPDVDSGMPQSLGKIPEDTVASLRSEEPQQSLPRTRSSQRNSAISAVDKVMKIIDQNIEKKVSSLGSELENVVERKSARRDSAFGYKSTPRDSLSIVKKKVPPLDPEEPQERNSCCRETRTGKCKLRKTEKKIEDSIPELDSERSLAAPKKSESYSDAILNVKKILENSMAEIDGVLLKKKENSEAPQITPSSVVQYSSTSSSDDSMVYFP